MLLDDFDDDGRLDLLYGSFGDLVACLDGLGQPFSCQRLPRELVSSVDDSTHPPEPRAIAWVPLP
jgi:hypothetical protein